MWQPWPRAVYQKGQRQGSQDGDSGANAQRQRPPQEGEPWRCSFGSRKLGTRWKEEWEAREASQVIGRMNLGLANVFWSD